MSLDARSCWAVLALLLAGCQGGGGGKAPPARKPEPPKQEQPPADDRAFYEGTPEMRARAAEQIARFEDPQVTVRLDAARRLTALGEPAIPALLKALAEHPSARTRDMSAYTLGFAKDHRARHPLARALSDPDAGVRLEVSTALLRLGDVRGFAPLVAALDDQDALVRARAINVLQDATGDNFGFRPDGEPQERQAAIARWKGWLERRRETGP